MDDACSCNTNSEPAEAILRECLKFMEAHSNPQHINEKLGGLAALLRPNTTGLAHCSARKVKEADDSFVRVTREWRRATQILADADGNSAMRLLFFGSCRQVPRLQPTENPIFAKH